MLKQPHSCSILCLWWFMTKFFPSWLRTLLGLAAGLGAGLYWGQSGLIVFDFLGDTFVHLITMLVIPLVFFTIASSIANLGQDGQGDMAGNVIGLTVFTLLGFMLTAAIASSIGLGIGHYFQPGQGIDLGDVPPKAPKEIPNWLSVLSGIVPSNLFKAFSEGKVLSVLFFALLFGASVASLGPKANTLRDGLSQASQAMFTLTRWVLLLTPFGVFGLMGSLVAAYGLAAISPLLPYMGLISLGCLIVLLIVYPTLILLSGLRVMPFFRTIFPAQSTAFFTCSSLGTLPVSVGVAVEGLKLKPGYAGFAIPLGANMKMDGCGGIYPAITAIFVANYFGIELNLSHYFIIFLTSILGSLATAGVPSAATVMLTLTLGAAGLPIEGLALVAGIDRIIDMIRTATNVTGQIVVPTLVARFTGQIASDSPLWRQPQSLAKNDIT